jgi:hypothetical protein
MSIMKNPYKGRGRKMQLSLALLAGKQLEDRRNLSSDLLLLT